MAIPSIIDSLDAVPEALRSEYKEVDGKYHLSVDGMVPKARLDEFRTTNIAKGRELDELKARYEGVDVDKYKELTALEIKQRDKKLIDAGKVDELVEARVLAMKADYDKTLKGLTDTNSVAMRQLESLLIDGGLKDHALKAGVLPSAMDDVVLRGRQVFRLQDGKASAFDGDKQMFGKDGEALSMAEWAEGLADRAPHLFTPSSGGGASKSGGSAPSAAGRIARDDSRGFLDNLDKIASGKVAVV